MLAFSSSSPRLPSVPQLVKLGKAGTLCATVLLLLLLASSFLTGDANLFMMHLVECPLFFLQCPQQYSSSQFDSHTAPHPMYVCLCLHESRTPLCPPLSLLHCLGAKTIASSSIRRGLVLRVPPGLWLGLLAFARRPLLRRLLDLTLPVLIGKV